MRFSEWYIAEKVSKLLHREREERGLSVSGLARKLELSERYTYKLLQRKTDMRLSTLAKVLDKLGYEVEFKRKGGY